MIFTRGKDLSDYAVTVSEVAYALAEDMARISELTGRAFTADAIFDEYVQKAKGPTVFECILIERGDLTEDEACKNHLAEMIYSRVAECVSPKADELRYFEVKFSDGNEVNAVWVCIRGLDEPTIEEAQWFMAADSAALKLPVTEVCEIDKRTARGCYDFTNEANWPIFSKGGAGGAQKNVKRGCAVAHPWA